MANPPKSLDHTSIPHKTQTHKKFAFLQKDEISLSTHKLESHDLCFSEGVGEINYKSIGCFEPRRSYFLS